MKHGGGGVGHLKTLPKFTIFPKFGFLDGQYGVTVSVKEESFENISPTRSQKFSQSPPQECYHLSS